MIDFLLFLFLKVCTSYALLFFSLFYFLLLLLFFFFFFFFLKLEVNILIHIQLCRPVTDKKNVHQGDFRKQDYFFLDLTINTSVVRFGTLRIFAARKGRGSFVRFLVRTEQF